MPSPVLRLAVPCFRVSYLWSHALYDEFFVRFACMCDVMQLVRVSFFWYFTISFYWCMNMEQCCRIRLRVRVCVRVCVCVCVCVCVRARARACVCLSVVLVHANDAISPRCMCVCTCASLCVRQHELVKVGPKRCGRRCRRGCMHSVLTLD